MSEEKKPVKGQDKRGTSPIMYIGPNLLTKGLKSYTVYKQEPTELIDSFKAEYANIGRLFVPVAGLDKAREDVEKKGTPINLAYQEMTE